MKKKGIRLLLLLVAAGILTAAFLVLNRRNREEEEQAKEEEEEEYGEDDGELLYSFDYGDMKQIAFTYGEDSYSFTKTDGVWAYDADPDFPIHQAYMETKASKLAEIYVVREIEGTDASRRDFGLDNPEVSVTLTLENGESYTFLMGKRNDTVGSYYMYDESSGKYYLKDGSFIVAFGDGFSLYDLAELEQVPTVSTSEVTHMYINGEENKNMDYLSHVAALEFSRGINYNASDAELGEYGLLEPQATLKVEYAKTANSATTEKDYTLLIGTETGDGERYVRFDGSREVSTVETSKLAFIFE